MSRGVTDETGTCNCFTGTPHIVNGVCTCDNYLGNVPPMPTTLPPAGYEWFYNVDIGQWVTRLIQQNNPVAIVVSHDPAPLVVSPVVDTIKNFIEQKPITALAIAGLALYFFTKKS